MPANDEPTGPPSPPLDPVRTIEHVHAGPQTSTDESTLPATDRPPALGADSPPGFILLRELGRGGMGVVYEARQVRLNRLVALKTLRHAGLADTTSIARFWAEAEAMAAVRHTNVAQVYELGEHGGIPFLAMELLPGGSLSDRLKGSGPLPPREAAELVAQIARGVAAAHELGIVHRDLKPANVLFGKAEGGKPKTEQEASHVAEAASAVRFPPSAIAKVTDFGLAKRAASDLTQTTALMGTPAYMSPEQAGRKAKFVGPPADVWALGVILFECLTGRRPFEGDEPLSIIGKVLNEEPPSLRVEGRPVPRDLDLVYRKCLEKNPADRYPTAAELADDLERFARGESISVRAAGLAERTIKWAKRKPTVAALWAAGGFTLALLAVAAAIAVLWRDAATARDAAEVQRGNATAARTEAETQRDAATLARDAESKAKDALDAIRYAVSVDLAHRDYQANNLIRARKLLAQCRADLRGWEWDYVHRLCHADVLTLNGHTGQVTVAAASPDDTLFLTAGLDGTARLWEAASGRVVHTLVANGKRILCGGFHPDGGTVITGGEDNNATIWDVKTGKPVCVLAGHTKRVTFAGFGPGGLFAITRGDDQTQRSWNRTTGKPVFKFDLPSYTEWEVVQAMSPEHNRGALDSLGSKNEGEVRIFDLGAGKTIMTLTGFEGACGAIAFDATATRIATGGGASDRTVRVWDGTVQPAKMAGSLPSGKLLMAFKGHTAKVTAVGFDPTGRVISGDESGVVRVWEPGLTGRNTVWPKLRPATTALALAPDSSRAAFRSLANQGKGFPLEVWDLRTLRRTCTPQFTNPAFWAFTADARLVVVEPNAVEFRNADTGEVVPGGWPFPSVARKGAATPGATRLATVHEDNKLRVWDVAAQRELRVLAAEGVLVRTAISNDGRRVVAEGMPPGERPKSRLWIWDVDTGENLTRMTLPDEVFHAAFSPDGTRVAAIHWPHAVKVWDIETGKELHSLEGHAAFVRALAFSPDGKRLATADENRTVKIWDASTGQELLTLTAAETGVWRTDFLAFTPDGRTLIAQEMSGLPNLAWWDSTPVNRAAAATGR